MKLNELEKKLQENPEFAQAMDDLKLHFELANAVLRARLQKGWSQTELAKAVGTKQANISKIESGLANPTLVLVRKLTKVLNLDVWIVEKPSYTQASYSVETTEIYTQTSIYEPNWPGSLSEPKYNVISDASAESEGYHV